MLKKNKTLVFDICITAIFIAIILVINFIFENIKFFSFSIQIFLIFYAIAIYKISNIIINIFFIIIVPLLLFAFEQNAYIINALQVFFEYFLVFYIFAILILAKYINSFFIRCKQYKLISYCIFISFFSLLIILKYILHCIASLTWWGKEPLAAFIFNLSWLFTNLFLIPISAIISFPIFNLFDHYQYQLNNKW